MISLKRYLDQNPDKLSQIFTEAYCATLNTVGEGAFRCCPATGEPLQREITLAAGVLTKDSSPGTFKSTHRQVLKFLRSWGDHTETYFARKTAEVVEVITELAGTAEFIGKRDQRYVQKFNEITAGLQSIAQLEDLSRMRTSLLRSAGELKGCVEKMAREGSETIAQLQSSVASHRKELDQAKELATLDPLTGLYNRRESEIRIGKRLASQAPFCVVLIDLKNFKQINDRHGNEAGDELLRQIANELRMASRAEDTIGRWDGDEFILVIDGGLMNTRIKVQRMMPWVFGNYQLNLSGNIVNVMASAVVGMAEWSPGETLSQVLTRAQAELYRESVTIR